MYIPSVNKVQIGLEAAYGDGAAATIQPPGILDIRIDPKVEAEQLKDKRGNTMPSMESFIKRRWVEGIVEGYLNYQEAYVWLDSMFGEATPAAGVYTYLASLDWDPEVEKSIALYYGQTGLIYKATGVLPSELTISGATGEPVQFSYKFFGDTAVDGASFAALSDDVVEWAMATHATIYLDAGRSAEPGTTPMTDVAFRFAANITANRVPVWHLGNQTPDTWRNGKWGGGLNLVLEADATILAHLGDIMDATATPPVYAVRIRITDTSNILDIDFVGEAIIPPNVITDSDGIVTVELELAPTYGSHVNMVSCWGAVLTVAP